MTACAALLALLVTAPALVGPGRRDPGQCPLPQRVPDPSVPSVRRGAGVQAAWRPGATHSASEGDRPGAAACAGDVCQPRVAIPGRQPGLRASRTDAVLALLSRSPLEPVSRVARFLADGNVRVDFSPALGHAPERGWGHLVVSLRWQLGASSAPAR